MSNFGLTLFLLVALPIAALFLFGMGPLGWAVLAGAVVLVLWFNSNDSDATDSTVTPVNCSDCGSPNDPEHTTCQYCGTEL